MKLLCSSFKNAHNKVVCVPLRPSLPSLMFVGEGRTLP
jgi:hypothetical protein